MTKLGYCVLLQRDIFVQVSDKPDLLKSKTPDSYTFTVTGLREIADKHGGQSSEVKDAQQLIADFIHKVWIKYSYTIVSSVVQRFKLFKLKNRIRLKILPKFFLSGQHLGENCILLDCQGH